jgi:isoamylase
MAIAASCGQRALSCPLPSLALLLTPSPATTTTTTTPPKKTTSGLDAPTYYMLERDAPQHLTNYSGCGHTVSGNNPITQRLIIDSLVHWVEEYRVDGFRFDLASCLCRDAHGNPLPAPPLIRAIAQHPVLSKTHLIAEPWDIGMYQVGSFPNWDTWGEWNGRFRDDVRKFVRGDAGCKAALATRVAGSGDLYNNHERRWWHGVNFVTAHDGFSLYDLVSYNSKSNGDNGEGNRDGSDDNLSWNCGHEGGSALVFSHHEGGGGGGDGVPPGVAALRAKQARNFWCALLLSQGVPMVVMGDELLQTHFGNNNWYGHDTRLSHMHWSGPLGEAEEGKEAGGGADSDDDLAAPARPPSPPDSARADLLRFASELVRWRRGPARHLFAGKRHFWGSADITWHEGDWGNAESRFLAWTLHDTTSGGGGGSGSCGDVYVAFNAHPFMVDAPLPGPVGRWARLVDTALPAPRDFTPGGNRGGVTTASYGVQAHSCVVLVSKWGGDGGGEGGEDSKAASAA